MIADLCFQGPFLTEIQVKLAELSEVSAWNEKNPLDTFWIYGRDSFEDVSDILSVT